jgi:hypothetical protein
MRTNVFSFSTALSIGACILSTVGMLQSQETTLHHRLKFRNPPPAIEQLTESREARKSLVTSSIASGTNLLPVFNYEEFSSRDGNIYDGVIVGANPSTRGPAAQVTIKAQVIPVILKFHTLGVSFNPKTGIFATASGDRTSDPTKADPGCFAGPTNVPVNAMLQSPIFRTADFNFGGTDVGTTQYIDAFQRGNFWSLIDKDNYHTLLHPTMIAPITIDVPAAKGISLNPDVFGPGPGLCGPEGLVEFIFFRNAIATAVSQLKTINPGTFPMLMLYNAAMPVGDPTNINDCCVGGFHSIIPAGPITFQAYSPFDFDVSGLFTPAGSDSAIASHEVGEFVNDPYLINQTPAWGHTGQVVGCQNNLEVGDPLTGNEAPRIVGKNGMTYHLQELAFFSWFFGNPSLGIHGWDSDNGTFLTDAGPPCM